MSYIALQQYWWFIVSLLGALLVFLMFVQGGQTLIRTLAKTETEKSMLINSIGRKWKFTFTTLVTFGGAAFASFPLFYSTSFGGAYWVWMIILFSFVIQAVSYEYRTKTGNFLGQKTYEVMLFINGLIATIFIGTAVATFFTGSDFTISDINQSYWGNSFHGIEAAFNIKNLCLGITIFFLSRILAILYFINTINHDKILARTKKALIINGSIFLVFFLVFMAMLLFGPGFNVDALGSVSIEKYKYFYNFMAMPSITIFFLLGVVLVLYGIISSIIKLDTTSIWYSGIGTILVVLMLFLVAGYNNTPFYPSLSDPNSSLTIYNASSSKFTLIVMAYVSLLIPFVLAASFYTWKVINKKKITSEEIEKEETTY
ncbi:MAG: cytochrome d ubiquinol oxidase subunit II [Bacteroidales bacterium]